MKIIQDLGKCVMRILWLGNVLLPSFCRRLGREVEQSGGWMVQLSDALDENTEVNFFYCAPLPMKEKIKKIKFGQSSIFYGFSYENWNQAEYDKSVEEIFKRIILQVKPDIVHIFGT